MTDEAEQPELDEDISFDPDSFLPRLEPKPGGMGILTLRDYQVECVDAIYEAWQDHQGVVAVCATGLGKTIIAAEVTIRWPGTGRILFIAHTKELIEQAREKIELHTDDNPSVEMGARRDRTDATFGPPSKVLVASIQSMTRRLAKFRPADFDLLIIDEFHHAPADTYRRLWQWLKDGNPNAKLLGITATPNRADKKTLKCLATHCAFQMGIREGIDEGWLVPIRQQYIVVDGLDFSKCRTTAGDLNEKDLEAAMGGDTASEDMSPEQRQEALEKQERMLHAIAAPAVKEAQGRTGIVYCVTVNHATRMAEILRRYPGVTAQVIHGKTPDLEREQLVTAFKANQLQFLVNVGVVTEGFDVPGAHLIVMGRPTASESLYTQMIGRATRPVAGLVDKLDTAEIRQEGIANSVKPFATVLDFVGNSGRHKLVSTADVLAGDMPAQFVESAKREMQKTGATEDIREAAWRKKKEHDEAVAARQETERKRKEDAAKAGQAREEARRARVRAEAEYRSREVDPFNQHDTAPQRVAPTYRGGSSDKQIGLLYQLGIPRETSMKWSKSQAGAVIGDLAPRRGGAWIMRQGKYRGKALKDIPHDYLKWAAKTVERPDFQENIEQYRQEWREQHRQP